MWERVVPSIMRQPKPMGLPSVPKDFLATPKDTEAVTLDWSSPDSDGGSPIETGYQYQQQESDSGNWSGWQDIPDSGVGEDNENSYSYTSCGFGPEVGLPSSSNGTKALQLGFELRAVRIVTIDRISDSGEWRQ